MGNLSSFETVNNNVIIIIEIIGEKRLSIVIAVNE